MRTLRRSAIVRRAVIPLLTVVWLTGCYKWGQPGKPIDQVVRADDTPSKVRLTRSDFSQIVLESPQLRGDSIAGWVPDLGETVSLPLSDVRQLEVRKTNWWTTGALIYLGVATVATIIMCADDTYDYYC